MTSLLKCNGCSKKYHFECIQPPTDTDRPKSQWRCPFCTVGHGAVVSSEAESIDERHDGEKLAFKIKRYMFISEILILLPSSVVIWRVGP